MTVEQLQARLRAIHARIGFEGRFCLSFDQDPDGICHVTHWFRPAKYAPEMWTTVGVGTIGDCLAALERYADGYVSEGAAEPDAETIPAYYGIAAE